MKRLLFLLSFCAVVFAIPSSFKRLSCGFKLPKIWLDLPACAKWEVTPDLSKEEIHSILSQQFTYLDRGSQCYVFVSKDDRYVVKLFRYDRALTKKKGKTDATMDKVDALFNACILAYTKAKEETGVLFLHLNPTQDQLPSLNLRGPLRQKIRLPLDNYQFVIQKKADSFERALFDVSKSDGMKQRIDAFLKMVSARIDKGIINLDPSLSRNFGFLEGKALEIDFGNYAEGVVSKENEMRRYTKRLRIWLVENAPEWVAYLDASSTQYSPPDAEL